ncbi:trk system potassium uptake protein TrkA [Lachnospiraceae bacterium C10]|jgi:trk system potassium uptake protein TrkA|nr:Trk system potassium transporter TrkA [Lachnospiraceae bacterium]SCW50099.1 trk system potassium uptake protein TrkA [Lachnospiraceae bacterium C10]SDW17489.1 trk system potassium uptake protein TrkA [Lachnospiraceae bacterium KHCPX20]
MFGFKDFGSDITPLRVIIVGCGKVGATLIDQLSREGNDITIIDSNEQKISEFTNQYDVMGYTGNGASYSVQKEAGIDDADLLIAVTGSDELNLLCCTVATRMGNCAAIARVRTPDYSSEINYLRDRLGLAMIINPEMEAAMETARILYLPAALEVNSFAHGEAQMIKFKIKPDCTLVGKAVFSIARATENLLFTCVERKGEVVIPNGNFVFEADDVVSFVTSRHNGREALKTLGIHTTSVRNCMIVGGGKAAFYLASQLLREGIDVKIIERDQKRCEELSVLLPNAIIINGDATDAELLREEGIQTIDSFVPLTGIDEENILLTLHAKQVSDAKVITKINRFAFQNVINTLDLGSVVYPRIITSEAIIAYARAKRASKDSNIETLYHMYDGRVEAIEFQIGHSSAVTGKPLKDLTLRHHLMVSFINRNGRIIFPSGNDTIEVGDTVMVVTTHTGFNDVVDILA